MAKQDRVLPHNIDAEQAVIGAMFINDDAIHTCLQILRPNDFYREDHRTIFECMMSMHLKNEPVDLVTVSETLFRTNMMEKAGGPALVNRLSNTVPTAANVSYYTNIVREKAELRNLIYAATEIAGKAYEGAEDVTSIIEEAEKKIMEIGSRQSTRGITSLNTVVMETISHFENLYNAKGQLLGIPTCFRDVDNMISGLQPSDLILVAARPSMGKTAFTLNIATNVAIKNKRPVAFFSLEMSANQLMMGIISSLAGVNAQQARTGQIDDDGWAKVMQTASGIYDCPLFIDDTPGINIMDLRTKARRIKSEHGLDLIIIDYLQLMQGRSNSEGRQQEVSEISRSLKALARELDVPIITLSQLNRGVEARTIKKPMLSDLRESGSLEQDADIVMFLYREDYYNPDTDRVNITDLIIAKHRNGPIGEVNLFFNKQFTRFENFTSAK